MDGKVITVLKQNHFNMFDSYEIVPGKQGIITDIEFKKILSTDEGNIKISFVPIYTVSTEDKVVKCEELTTNDETFVLIII